MRRRAGTEKGFRAMNRSLTMAILAAAALLLGEWAWAPPNVWAQQGTGPAGQGMMTGQASQGGAATGPGMAGQPGGSDSDSALSSRRAAAGTARTAGDATRRTHSTDDVGLRNRQRRDP